MNVSELLKNTDKTLFSFEVLPPLKGRGIDAIYQTIDSLLEFNPAYINITSHAADEQYKQNADGTFDKVIVHKRPSTVASAAAIKYKYNIEVVPHIICSGLNAEEIENILKDKNVKIEVVMKIMKDYSQVDLKNYYWYVGAISTNGDTLGILIDANDGEIIAKKA